MKLSVVMLTICVPAGVCARSGIGDPRVANTAPMRAQDTQPAAKLVWGPRPCRMMRVKESIMARRGRLLDPSPDPDEPRRAGRERAGQRRGDVVAHVADGPASSVRRRR